MTTRHLISTISVGLAALFCAQRAGAENLAYQFVCIDDGHQARTGWLDERISVRTMFEKGRTGEQYHYCRADCRPDFGIRNCSFSIPSERNNWGPWVERRHSLSCDSVCLNIQAVDGRLESPISTRNLDITRYDARFTSDRTIPWEPRTHTRATNYPTSRSTKYDNAGRRYGYEFCWNTNAWGENYWVTKYDPDNPDNNGIMTEVVLREPGGRGHIFRVLGYYDTDEVW